jgi:hypothetical protein
MIARPPQDAKTGQCSLAGSVGMRLWGGSTSLLWNVDLDCPRLEIRGLAPLILMDRGD